jgi:hypothetical protein
MFKRMMGGVLAGLALSMLVPAGAAAAFCPDQPAAQRFLRWADPAWYVALPGGGFEPSTPAWTLTGGAAVVEGNEPFYIGGAGDHRSLRLPPDATGTSPAMCLGVDHPTLRLLVSNSGAPLGSKLVVSAVFRGVGGEARTVPIATLVADDKWAPTLPLLVGVNALALLSPQSVAFRFDAEGGTWAIDDVYVDPYGKG